MAAIREDSSLLFTFHFPATVGFFTLHFSLFTLHRCSNYRSHSIRRHVPPVKLLSRSNIIQLLKQSYTQGNSSTYRHTARASFRHNSNQGTRLSVHNLIATHLIHNLCNNILHNSKLKN